MVRSSKSRGSGRSVVGRVASEAASPLLKAFGAFAGASLSILLGRSGLPEHSLGNLVHVLFHTPTKLERLLNYVVDSVAPVVEGVMNGWFTALSWCL
jgi:hypothetical protein